MSRFFLALFLLTISTYVKASEVQTNSLVPVAVGDITIFIPINDPPSFSEGETIEVAVDEDKIVSGNLSFFDESPDSVSLSIISAAVNGTASITQQGLFQYEPLPNYYGNDSFIVRATDSEGLYDEITVSVSITPVNDAPNFIVSQIALSTNEDNTLTFSVERDVNNNLLVVDEDSESLTFSIDSQPSHGIATLVSNNSIRYEPNSNFHGQDQIVVKATDQAGAFDTLLVYLNVNSIPDNFTVSSLSDVSMQENDSYIQEMQIVHPENNYDAIEFDISSVFVDVFGNHSESRCFKEEDEMVVWGRNGEYEIEYRPSLFCNHESGFISGNELVTLTITDGNFSHVRQFSVFVQGVDNPPEIQPGKNWTVEVSANEQFEHYFVAIDPDSNFNQIVNGLTWSTSSGNNGYARFESSNRFVFTPNQNFQGTENLTISYTAENGDTNSMRLELKYIPSAPTGELLIVGQANLGSVLKVVQNFTDGDVVVDKYQWYADDEPIDGANRESYFIKSTDKDKQLSASIAFSDGVNDFLLFTDKTAQVGAETDYLELDKQHNIASYTKTHNESVGYTAGSLSVSPSGKASYTIPIDLPKGVLNSTPNLSFNYSSGGGNGIMGKGWSVGGLSMISRCGETLLIDGVASSVKGDNSDKLCFNGSRLYLQSGTYGISGSKYKTEIENHTTFTLSGNLSSSSATISATYSDGSTASFGKSDNSRIKSSSGTIYKWAISQRKDIGENAIDYSYKNHSTGFHFDEIEYSEYSVKFSYEDRDDKRTSYASGIAIDRHKRLTDVEVFKGTTSLKTYSLAYVDLVNSTSTLSKLESIQECVGTTCLPETIFDWTQVAEGLDATTTSEGSVVGGEYVTGASVADVNGDGFSDLVLQESDAINSTDCKLKTYLGSVDGLSTVATEERAVECAPHDVQHAYKVTNSYRGLPLADINNDGRADHNGFVTSYDSSSASWKTYSNVATDDFIKTNDGNTVITGNSYRRKPNIVVDLNGDGLKDYLTWNRVEDHKKHDDPDYKTYWFYSNELKVSFAYRDENGEIVVDHDSAQVFTFNEDYNIYKMQFGDFDGDGTGDLLLQESEDSGCCVFPSVGWYRAYNFTNGSARLVKSFQAHLGNSIVGDINGDGLSDVVFKDYEVDDDGNENGDMELYYVINDGKSDSQVPVQIETDTTNNNYFRFADAISLFDYNQDGQLDLTFSREVWLWDDGEQKFVEKAGEIDFVSNGIYADFNGDGLIDVLELGAQTTRHVSSISTFSYYPEVKVFSNRETNELSNRIEKITLGNGHVTEITYENIAATDHYKPFDVNASGSSKISDVICIDVSSTNCENVYSSGASSESEFYDRLVSGPLLPSTTSDSLGETFGVTPVVGNLAVVTKVESSNPHTASRSKIINSTAKATTEYFYGRAFNQESRGFLGFETMTIVDHEQGIETQTVYRQDYPFSGQAYLQQIRTAHGYVVATTYTDWRMNRSDADPQGAPLFPYQIYPATSKKATYDPLDGTFISFSQTDKTLTDSGFSDVTTTVVKDAEDTQLKQTVKDIDYDQDCTTCTERGLPQFEVVTMTMPELSDVILTTEYQYYDDTESEKGFDGQLKAEISEPGDDETTYATKTVFEYDSFGNPTKATLSSPNLESRTTTTEYDSTGRYIKKKTNAKNHVIEEVVDVNSFGQPTVVNGINGVVMNFSYDVFGRQIYTDSNIGNWSATDYQWCEDSGNCPASAVIEVKSSDSSGSYTYEYQDVLGRTIESRKVGFDGRMIHQHFRYNDMGNVYFKSVPCYECTGTQWTEQSYDVIGRATTTILPDQTRKDVFYDGLTTTYTNALLQSRTETKDVLGQIIEITDNDGARVSKTYDQFGNLLTATSHGIDDEFSIVIENGYDALGRKEWMNDPDKGYWEFKYNEYAELEWQINANRQKTEFEYDRLGRMTLRRDRDQSNVALFTTVWKFDGDELEGAPTVGGIASVGVLTAVAHNTGSQEVCGQNSTQVCQAIAYDNQGKPTRTTTSYGANGNDGTYTTTSIYDGMGRVIQELDITSTDEHNKGVYRHYNAFGYVFGMSNIDGDEYRGIYMVDELTARGKVKLSTRGNNAVSEYTYFPDTGMVSNQSATIAGRSRPIQDIDYTWDEIGNLKTRSNNSGRTLQGYTDPALEETFCYDGLNRIVAVETGLSGSCSGEKQFDYNSIGNITLKQGVGTYGYVHAEGEDVRPHAVATTTLGNVTHSYEYDDNGNLTNDSHGRVLTYTPFDKPLAISLGDKLTRIYYGPNRERWKRIDTDTYSGETVVTLYLSGVEKVVTEKSDVTTTDIKRYLGGGAVFTERTAAEADGNVTQVVENHYIYKDHQGSTDVITDEDGNIVTLMGFDVWGARRGGYQGNSLTLDELKQIIDQRLGQSVNTSSLTTKGFTGHEMLDGVGLIHMNGRVYNPTLGRFVSADPLIPQPLLTQSYNRYSYVQNRPTFYTDPSGFAEGSSCGDDSSCNENDMEIVEVNGNRLSALKRAALQASVNQGATSIVSNVQNDVADSIAVNSHNSLVESNAAAEYGEALRKALASGGISKKERRKLGGIVAENRNRLKLSNAKLMEIKKKLAEMKRSAADVQPAGSTPEFDKGVHSLFRGISRYVRHERRILGYKGPGPAVQANTVEQMLLGEALILILSANQQQVDALGNVLADNFESLLGRQVASFATSVALTGEYTWAASLSILAGAGDVYHSIESLALELNINITTVDHESPILPQIDNEIVREYAEMKLIGLATTFFEGQ